MKNNSIWLENLNDVPNKSLNENKEVDVLIIGGGITGMNILYQFKDSNLKVCLVERNLIGRGVTARTTAKLTYLQELIYGKLKTFCSNEDLKLYLDSQRDAIKEVEKIVKENNIDCNFETVKSFVFTNDDNEVSKIDDEKNILESLGVSVEEANKLPNNVECKKAIYVDDTAVFHPLKYLIMLKQILNKSTDIYENTKIETIDRENDIYICKTKDCEIKAKNIVFAIHYPYFLFPYLFPLKAHLEKSYIAAFKTKDNLKYSAITSSKPTISLRYYSDKYNYEIYLSKSHNLSMKNNEEKNFHGLLKQINTKANYIWSNKDIITSDHLPYIGLLKENMYIATGYNTWGMTNSVVASKIIPDLILKKENKFANLFDPNRSINVLKVINFPINIASNIKSFVGSKINKNKSWYKNVEFKEIDGEKIGIYKDENNKEHIVYNRCPHLKCGLIFNEIEKTWDCPCHGSRFDIDGNCIEGPSNYDIKYKK